MKNYKIVLIEILIISSFIGTVLFGSTNTTVNYSSSNKDSTFKMVNNDSPQIADDFILPTPDPPNENFTWGFSNGTELGFIYERFNDTEYSSGVEYYNITSMPNIIANFTELDETAYCVQLEELYFDTTLNKNLPVSNTPLVNVSLVNFTADMSEVFPGAEPGYLFPGFPPEDDNGGPSPGWIFMMINPFIPKNDTELAFNWSAQGLKLWYSMFLEGIDVEIITDTGSGNRNLYFENSISEAYVNITYDEDGIIIYGELYSYDDEEDGYMTTTLTRTYDLNPLDEIEWAVNEGDLLYYGINTDEVRINITRIVNITVVNVEHNFRIVLQQVVANMTWWNDFSKTWEQSFEGVIGSANEQYPLYMVNRSIPLFVPIGAKASDVYSFFQQRTGPDEDYDSAVLEDQWITIINSTTQAFEKYLFNSSGYIDLIHMVGDSKLFDYDPGLLYRKNSTIIDGTILELDISPFGTEAFNITLNISVTAESHLLTSAFNINPTNITGEIDNYGVLFIDIWLNDTSKLDFTLDAPINVSIEYDSAVYKNMKLWYWNITSLEETWKQMPFTDLGNGVIVFSVNYTAFFAFTNVPISILPSGDDDDDDDDKETVVIPFGNYYLLFLAIGVISLVYYYKKRKI